MGLKSSSIHTQADKTSKKCGGRRLWGCLLADFCQTYRMPHYVTEFHDFLTLFTTLEQLIRPPEFLGSYLCHISGLWANLGNI